MPLVKTVKIKIGATVHHRMQSWKWPNPGKDPDEQFEIIGQEESTGMLHLVSANFGGVDKAGSTSIFVNPEDCIHESTPKQD